MKIIGIFADEKVSCYAKKTHTWCPEQIVPFGILALKGLCTGHDVRGPHREDPGNGTELKLFGCPLHGLQSVGGGGRGP